MQRTPLGQTDLTVSRLGFPSDKFAFDSFKHLARFSYEICKQIIHHGSPPK